MFPEGQIKPNMVDPNPLGTGGLWCAKGLRAEKNFNCFALSPTERPEVSVPGEEKEVLQSEGTPQTHYFRMNCSQAFLSGFLLEAKLSQAKNNLSGESMAGSRFSSWSHHLSL